MSQGGFHDGRGVLGDFNATTDVLDDFNATIGTDRDGHELCAGLHVSGLRDENHSMLREICGKSEIEDSWILVPEAGIAPLDFVFQ